MVTTVSIYLQVSPLTIVSRSELNYVHHVLIEVPVPNYDLDSDDVDDVELPALID